MHVLAHACTSVSRQKRRRERNLPDARPRFVRVNKDSALGIAVPGICAALWQTLCLSQRFKRADSVGALERKAAMRDPSPRSAG